MEELPVEDQTKDPEEDQKKKKKRRVSSFLKSWLKVSGETGKEAEDPKKPFSERAWKVFEKFFSSNTEQPQKIEEKPAEEPQQLLEFAPANYEQKTAEPEAKSEDTEPRKEAKPSTKQPAEGGELVIDHRAEEEEDWQASVEEALAYEPLIKLETPLIPLQRQAELVQIYDQAEFVDNTVTSKPEKIGDVLERRQKQTELELMRQKRRNRRRNRRLKKQVHELKSEANVSSKKQESLKKEQSELETEVELLKQRPDVGQLIARQERERAELRANRGLAARPETVTAEIPRSIAKPERTPVSVTESRPRRPEHQTEIPRPSETIIQQFERLPQQDTHSERDFERRHEVKDEAGSQQAATYVALASADAAYRAAAAQINQAQAARSYPTPPALPTPQPAFQASDLVDSPMYRQAMRNGFLTAVILLAVWFVISLLQ